MMNYVDKMNSISQCVTGLCEHPEHKVNNLVWIIPSIIAAYFLAKILPTPKRYRLDSK